MQFFGCKIHLSPYFNAILWMQNSHCRFAHFFGLDYFLGESRIGRADILPDGRGRSCAYPHPLGPIHPRHRFPDRQHWGNVTIDLDWVSEDEGHPREVPLRSRCPLFWVHQEILLVCKNQRTNSWQEEVPQAVGFHL